VHAENREAAIAKMRRALTEFEVNGPHNNIKFLRTLLSDEKFQKGEHHTQYLDQNPQLAKHAGTEFPLEVILAAAVWHEFHPDGAVPNKSAETVKDSFSNWRVSGLAEFLERRM
jgi:acetyl/propionyl-CoA carboxylase alpha subunit